MKKVKYSKTIWAGIITIILPLVLNYLTPETLETLGVTNPYVISFLGAVFTWLRTITKTGLTLK